MKPPLIRMLVVSTLFRAISAIPLCVFPMTGQSDAQPAKDTSSRVEIVKREELLPKTPQDAIVCAFSLLGGRLRHDQPILITTRRTVNSIVVNCYKISSEEFGSADELTIGVLRKLESVIFVNQRATIEAGDNGRKEPGSTLSAKVSTAIAYLHGLGGLPREFELMATENGNGHCRIELYRFPITPGGHTVIDVSEDGVTIQPGA